MTQALGASADEVQLTLSVYMFGWALAQLYAGPVSDRVGRRTALLWALVVFTAASLACALARDVHTLIVARFVQAFAMATVVVVPRAVVRDLHAGDRAAHMLSTMMMILSVAPIVAPLIGAELLTAFGWRSNFTVVALYGAVLWAAVRFGLPETLARRDAEALAPGTSLGNWGRALAARRYRGFLLAVAFSTCGLFAFLAGSAFVFVVGLGSGERAYAVYFGLVMLGCLAGAAVARRVVRRIGLERLIERGAQVELAAGAVMAALAWLGVREPLAVVVPMFVFMAAYMAVVPQATAGALTPFPEIAGSAASLLSFAQFVIAATAALVVGLAFDGTPRPMATGILAAAALTWVSFRILVRRPAPPHARASPGE
jgi:DHA1 family bicyclomycin/chloramphenicol resistance-like MFS transporter